MYGCLLYTSSKTPENVPGAEVGFFWFGEEEKNVTALNITHGAKMCIRDR